MTNAILNTVKPATANHIVVEAFAGCGKTFTSIVGVGWAYSNPTLWEAIVKEMATRKGADPKTFTVTPSDEQQAVWEALRAIPDVSSVTYSAFNKSIVNEFESDWGWMAQMLQGVGVDLKFATVNSLGYGAVREAFGYKAPTDWHVRDIVCELLGLDPYETNRDPKMGPFTRSVAELVGLCKLELLGWTEETGFDAESIDEEDLHRIVSHYAIELNGGTKRAFELVPQVLAENIQVAKRKNIDWNDQNWLPVVLDLPMTKVDVLLVDEGQDLPRCKQEFGRKLGRNLIVVGDCNQAIYGFAGADVDSIPRMKKLLGVENSLRLTETRRCGKAIVEKANETLQKIYELRKEEFVPFKAHETNGPGEVKTSSLAGYPAEIEDGDMVICRVNAPLVSQALGLLKEGRKVVIRGRDFGASLLKFIDKLKAENVSDLLAKVSEWVSEESDREMKRKYPSDARLIAITDRQECIEAFADGSANVEEVKAKINLIFAGKKCPKCGTQYGEEAERCSNKSCKKKVAGMKYPIGPELVKPSGVVFSSIHKAKGLEARRVVLLLIEGASIPHPMAKTKWQYGQEWNCLYIAQTRAIETLIEVYA